MVGSPGDRCSNYFPGASHEPIRALGTLNSVVHMPLHPRVCNLRLAQAAQHRVQATLLAAGEEDGSLPGTALAPFGEQEIFALQVISRESRSGGRAGEQTAAPGRAETPWLLERRQEPFGWADSGVS